jgi:hypothetical protein
LLCGYDRQVEEVLQEALEATTGTERVRFLHKLRSSLSVHDSVLNSALCPLLDDLPGGPAVADRLRQGCHERADLLIRFRKITNDESFGLGAALSSWAEKGTNSSGNRLGIWILLGELNQPWSVRRGIVRIT